MIEQFSILKANGVCTFAFCIVLNIKHLLIKSKSKRANDFYNFLAFKILNLVLKH